jgi:hypothetical protein
VHVDSIPLTLAHLKQRISRILIARATHALFALDLRYNRRMDKRITPSAA